MRFSLEEKFEASGARESSPDLNLLSIVSGDHGFKRIESGKGFDLFSNGTDFVAVVDFRKNARLNVIAGDRLSAGGRSATGGQSPEFGRMTSAQAMERSRSLNPASKCVLNGSFFANQNDGKAQLAFPMMVNGKLLSHGFAPLSKHDGKRLALKIFDGGAQIAPVKNKDVKALEKGGAEDALVSLSPAVDIDGRKESLTGRTFIGLDRKDDKGLYTRALVFVSARSSQLHAELTLKRFGARQVIMLDGGGSSQLRCGKTAYVGGENQARSVPQFLSIETDPEER